MANVQVEPSAPPQLSVVEEPRLVHVLAQGYVDIPSGQTPKAAVSHHWRGESLLIYKKVATGKLWCIQAICPHAGAHFGGADIEDLTDVSDAAGGSSSSPFLSCPAHAYVFSVETGTCITEDRSKSWHKTKFASVWLIKQDDAASAETDGTSKCVPQVPKCSDIRCAPQ